MYPSEYGDYSFEQWGAFAVVAVLGGIVWLAIGKGFSIAPTATTDPVKEVKPFPKAPVPPGELSLSEITAELSAIRDLMEKVSDYEFPDLVSPFERHINRSVDGYNAKVAKYVSEMQKCLEESRVLLEEERARKSKW